MPAKYEEVELSLYDPWITIKKFFTGLGIVIVPVILLYLADFLDAEVPNLPSEIALFIPFAVAAIHAFVNWWKHRGDTQTVKMNIKTGEIVD